MQSIQKSFFLFAVVAVAAFSFCKNEAPKAVAAPSKTAEKAPAEATKTEQFAQPKPRAAMPADATCFRAKDKDGQRTWELRMVKMSATDLRADLLVTSSQSTEFAQGQIDGLKKDGNGFFGTWSFRVAAEKMAHIQRVSYLQKGKNLIERSQNPPDDGRLFEPCACAELK